MGRPKGSGKPRGYIGPLKETIWRIMEELDEPSVEYDLRGWERPAPGCVLREQVARVQEQGDGRAGLFSVLIGAMADVAGPHEDEDVLQALYARPGAWKILEVDTQRRRVVFKTEAGGTVARSFKTIESTLTVVMKNLLQ